MRALLTATFLLATLLSATALATAAPPTAADPPDILTPTGPPEPRPCQIRQIPCDITLPPLAPETADPDGPATDAPGTDGPATTTTTSPGREAPRSSGDTDTGTAAGPGDTTTPAPQVTPGDGNWWLIAVPVLALLALAAAGAFLLIQRTERRQP